MRFATTRSQLEYICTIAALSAQRPRVRSTLRYIGRLEDYQCPRNAVPYLDAHRLPGHALTE